MLSTRCRNVCLHVSPPVAFTEEVVSLSPFSRASFRALGVGSRNPIKGYEEGHYKGSKGSSRGFGFRV